MMKFGDILEKCGQLNKSLAACWFLPKAAELFCYAMHSDVWRFAVQVQIKFII